MHALIISTLFCIICVSYLNKGVEYTLIILMALHKYKSTTLVTPPTVWLGVIDVYTERPRVCSTLYTRGCKMEEQQENLDFDYLD